jgi:hypothetical protein
VSGDTSVATASALFPIGGNVMHTGEWSRNAFDKAEREAMCIGLDELSEAIRTGLVTRL